ncbi:hypothetical protein AJ79_02822 [Helicocarpus griseus UAMH5409]|uniref:Nonribosomal peptide synthetase sidC n=1 Tax=Helicocarpus griseus UAMH5409 TaxID=1447875 RepID=A0A2B7Y004_9EURO|nr:hypothetical protein AJ79_02822 [Helicocarpus griseus UAMH5409]
MEATSGERYTSFPDLDYGQDEVPSSITIDWKVDDCHLSVNALVLSWASLLKSITGNESPIFSLDGQPIKADPSAGNFRTVDLDESMQGQRAYTGIFTTDSISPPSQCNLAIRYDFERFAGYIMSTDCTSVTYLTQIGRQLTEIVRQQLKLADDHQYLNGSIGSPQLSVLNPTPELLPGPYFLHDLVRSQGCEQALAIEFLNGDKTRSKLSFESLHLQSTALALRVIAALNSLPIPCKRNPIIPVLLPQSVHFYVAWLAILKAGAAVCPLSLDTPPERVNFIANDVCADVVITTQSLAGRLEQLDRPIHIITAEDVIAWAADCEAFQPPQIQAGDIAYLEYTSGSTGLPKGVAVSHRAATQSLLAHDRWIPQFRRFLQFASPTFDVSIFEIFFPLFRGATLVGCDRNLMLSDLPRVMTELDVDAAELTPTVAGELLRQRSAAPCLRVLLTIGEMLTRRVIDEFGASPNNDGMLYGMYGPTEAAIHCTLAPTVSAGSRVGNIGVPLQTVSAFIISSEPSGTREPEILSIGHVGELAVGGPQLAECYVNRDEETRKAFLDTETYGRIYRTGDKARLHPSGELECLGRISTGQVKLRGQRIELGEIERVIFKVCGVRNVVVSVLEGILLAFVSVDETFPGINEIWQMCQKWLPKFMVPGDIELLDYFPQLPSGKIDKRALEKDYHKRRLSQRTSHTQFVDDVQRIIASCAEDILSLRVSTSDSLAASGLDSLKAIRLCSALRNAGINVDVLGILEADSIGEIATLSKKTDTKCLATSRKFENDDWKSVVDATLEDLKLKGYSTDSIDLAPCSPVQIAMLSESMRDPNTYFNWIELQFHGGIDISSVKNAFCEIALHNEILRSGFISTDFLSYPDVQVIWNDLEENQLQEVPELSYDQTANSETHLLRPFRVDLTCVNGHVRAFVHIHHALYDGWSWDHILSDIEGLLSAKPLPLRPQYRLFTDYCLKHISDEDRESAVNYWRSQLDGVTPSSWPNFQDTSDVPAGLQTVQKLLNIRVQDLDIAVQNLRVSRQTIFQAAFGYILSAYNGNPDTIFGSVSSGRTLSINDIENIIGPCMTTTPLRLNIGQLRTVHDLVGAVHNLNRKSLKHGFLPLADIKQASGIDPEYPLFDSLFVWQETLNGDRARSGLVTEVKYKDFLEFNMTLEFGLKEGKILASANFQQSILPDSQIVIFLRQIEQLASIFINTPEILLRDVNNHLANSTLSIENPNYIKQTNLPNLADGVERLARVDPERIAVEFLNAFDPYQGTANMTSLTYGEMDIRSNQLANHLCSCGLPLNSLVSIFLEKSIDLYVAIIAVIKAGCGYVPITPQTPTNRVNTIIDEANCSNCITDSALSLRLGESQTTPMIAIDDINFDDLPATRPQLPASESSIAYCTFTSGSTGKPKGVLITHHNLQSNIAVLSEMYPNPPGSKLLQACSHAFDVSVFEIFFALNEGMTLCSAVNDVLFRDMEQAIRVMEVTHLSLTPTVASLLNPENIPKVKFLVTAGEAMTEKVFKSWASKGAYHAGYGPSETTNICTVRPNIKATDFINNIGRPFKNTSAFVVSEDDDFRLVPRGAVGEFCFGGDQVGHGYLKMPELTRSKFISHPQYGRIYKSGDFGRMLPDGSLIFTGRRDDQVKLRGQRIELGETNRVILQNPDVIDCTSFIVGDAANQKQQLISFWVPAVRGGDNFENFNSRPKVLEIFDHISAKLPGYMIPSMLIPIPAIPITTSGKTDKTGLLKHFQMLDPETLHLFTSVTEALGEKRQFSDTEMKVAELVSLATQTPLTDIALHTSFYSLGLNSISAISLSRRLKLNGFGQIDVSAIMKHNTVYRLSKRIAQCNDQPTEKLNTSANLERLFSAEFMEQMRKKVEGFGRRIQKILPCTPLQEAMLMRKSTDNSLAYYNQVLFETVDVDRLKYAWNTMVQRHDILRSYFAFTDDARFAYAQIVLDSIDPPWIEISTTHEELNNRIEEQKLELTKDEKNIVPYSFTVIQIPESETALFLFLIHHALYDGEAMSQLLEEIESVSFGISLPPAISFDLYLSQMIRMDIEAADRFWASHLSELSPSYLTDPQSRRSSSESRRFGAVGAELDVPLSKITEACKDISITLLSLVQATWAKLLLSYTQQPDICFGNVFSCRSIPVDGAERIVGPCLNTLPVRIKADSNTMNSDLAKGLQQLNAAVLPYQLTSLRRLQSRFGHDNLPLFDTLVLLQNNPRPLNDKLWKLVEEKGDMDLPLVCEAIPNNEVDALRVILHYDDSQFALKDVDIILSAFKELIHNILLYPFARAMDSSVIAPTLPSFVHENRCNLTEDVSEARKSGSSGNERRRTSPDAWSPHVQKVQDVLSSLSKVDTAHINPHTTIFQLGLDSINAVQISARFKALAHDISVIDILEKPSVEELASLLSRRKDNGNDNPHLKFDFEAFESRHWSSVCQKIEVSERHIESIRPCTPVQSGVLALFNHSEGDLYFNHLTLKSTIPLNPKTVRRAWIMLQETHEIFRAGFIQVNDTESPFAMVTYGTGTFELPWSEEADLTIKKGRRLDRERMSKDVLSKLHQPPWRISLQQRQSHVLLQFSALHSLYDAQSLNLLLSDLTRLLKGEALSTSIPILPVQDSIISASIRASKDPECETFWREFGKDARVSKFPDMSPIHQKKEVHVLVKPCSKTLQILEEGCREAGVTLQAAGQAAWARILASYTGESKVTFGLVLSGRSTIEGVQQAAFPCLTTVPSSYNIEGSNRDLLQRIMKLDASLVKYQFTPLPKIYQWIESGSSLFDTIFVFQKHWTTAANDIWEVYDEEAKTDYPISIELIPTDGRLEYQLTFETDILPEGQADILLSQLDNLLNDTIFCQDSSCTHFSDADSSELLSALTAKESNIPSPVNLVHQFVEVQAQEHPSKIALEFAFRIPGKEVLVKRKWTYKEFDDCGNIYANLLQKKGAAQGSLIGICFDKCPEAYFAILAILKVGCAYVALDPGAPEARKKFILDDSGAKILLSTSDKKEELEGLPVLFMDSPGILDGVPSYRPILQKEIQPHDSCYCLYTSGTTGTPKGCEITHDNVIQAMLSFQRLFDGHWDETSRWLQFASFHFDVSVLEQYWSWSVGICVTSCPRDTLFEDLSGTIRELEITHIDLTPSLARLLDPDDVPSLRRGVFITGGEQLKQEILEAWGDYKVIYNGYGPTEVTIGCTMLPRVPRNGKPSNIGPQFDNVGSFVFKPGTTIPVMRGGVGELCVSGALVGRGYINRPQLTQEKFQFIDELAERVYRTGDLVRLLHDNSFCFLGRIDDQVKLRGQRLETGEINQVISDSAVDVGEVVTMVLKHSNQSKEQLVSFFTTDSTSKRSSKTIMIDFDPSTNTTVAKINQACRNMLPGYMVPTHVIPVTAFPLNANNKIDQRQLKSIYENMTLEEMRQISSLSRSNSHTVCKDVNTIMTLASKMTGIDVSDISPWSSIFELGLDSISALTFSRLLRDSGFKSAQPSLLMKNPTISALSDALGRTTAADTLRKGLYQECRQRIAAFSHKNLAPVAQELSVPLTFIEGIAPCTPLQEGMIYRYVESQKPVYFTRFNFELSSTINLSRLKAAWLNVQHSVQILRTKFPLAAGSYAQVILKEDHFPWFELAVLDDFEVDDVALDRYKKWCNGPKNLTGRVWEVGVIIGPSRIWMCLNIFHGLYDGNSLSLLLNMVLQTYIDPKSVRETPPYIDGLVQGPLCKVPGTKEFWLEHLSGPPKALPFKDNVQEASPVVASLEIRNLDKLEALRRKLDVLEQAVFLACWLRVLDRHLKFVPTVGIVVSGRALDTVGAEEIIGPMFNTLPCNVQCSNISSMGDLIRSCHAYYVSTLRYQHTPLRDIMKWLPRRSATPLFDNLFVFQREFAKLPDSGGSTLWSPIAAQAEPDYPVAFEAQRNQDGSLLTTLVAQGGVFTPETAQQLTFKFRDILVSFLDNPLSKLRLAVHESDVSKTATLAGGNNSEPRTNGHKINGSLHPFEWTATASRLREEIATIARVDVLNIQEKTSIFEVGLDSIDAIKLSSCLTKAGIKLSVTTIMRGRTIENIMRNIESSYENGTDGSQTSLEDLEKALWHYFQKENYDLNGVERLLPATPLQEAMVLEMVVSNFNRYFNHDILEIRENIHVGRLKRAWQEVVDANAILRTSFAEVSDPGLPFTYAQLIQAPGLVPLDWSMVDTTSKSIDTILEEERQKATAACSTRRPLLKIQLLHSGTSGGKKFMLLSMPHAMYDGWALDLLHEDVAACYSGQSPNIRESCDMVLSHILNSASEPGLQFWKGALSGIHPTAFPKQKDAGGDGSKVHRKERVLGISKLDIRSFCKAQGITLQALGLTCWALVLAGYLGKLDVVFGTVLAGRDLQGAEQIMFPLMSSVAVRLILHGSRSDMLKYSQETLLPISEHQHIPLRTAKQVSGFGSQNLFDTLFIFQKRPTRDRSSQEPLYESVGGFSDVEYPVCIEMEEVNASIVCRVACRDTVLGESDVSRLLDRVDFVLNDVIKYPDSETINFGDDGISVCQCPVFQEPGANENSSGPYDAEKPEAEPFPLEQEIRLVLSSVSGVPVEEISREATLFHLGLDSISAIKVAALLKKKDIMLSVSDMLRAGTVPNMARLARPKQVEYPLASHDTTVEKIMEEVDTNLILQSHSLSPRNIEKVIPATAGQVYMLNMHESSHGQLFYPCFFYRIEGAEVTKDTLELAWASLIKELPILRTQFLSTRNPSMPYIQAVLSDFANPVVWQQDLDLQGNMHLGTRIPDHQVPVTLYASQQADETILMLHIHHALYDAVSLPLMINMLAIFCASPSRDSNLQPLSKPDLSELVAYQHKNSSAQTREMFWKNHLSPTGFKQQKTQSSESIPSFSRYNVKKYRQSLVEDISQIERLGRVHGISVQALFLAVYARIHSKLLSSKGSSITAPKDLVIGIYLANRSHSLDGLSELIAPTLNIVPLRITIWEEEKQSIFDLAQSIQGNLHEVGRVEHSCVSLIEIAEWTGVRVDTCVNFIKLPDTTVTRPGDAELAEGTVRIVPLEEREVKVDGDVDADVQNGFKEDSSGIPKHDTNGFGTGYYEETTLQGDGELINDKYTDIFKPGIDVEAAVRGNGLDVGIFGRSDRISKTEADHVLDELCREILGIMKIDGADERN